MSAFPGAGEALSPQAFPAVTAEMLRRYAEASGDSNPIHLDESVARGTGLPGIIAHGMLASAWLAERALAFSGPLGLRMVEFSSRFRAMVFLGDVIAVGGTVKEVTETSVTIDLLARNQKGETTTTGYARFER
jgi:acyl dehydratase